MRGLKWSVWKKCFKIGTVWNMKFSLNVRVRLKYVSLFLHSKKFQTDLNPWNYLSRLERYWKWNTKIFYIKIVIASLAIVKHNPFDDVVVEVVHRACINEKFVEIFSTIHSKFSSQEAKRRKKKFRHEIQAQATTTWW